MRSSPNGDVSSVDAYASHAHLVAHIAPIWRALPEETRGTFFVAHRWLLSEAARHGVDATFGEVHGAGLPVLVANRHDLTQCPRRVGVFVEHGAGQTYPGDFPHHPSYSGGSQRDRVGLFLTLNATTAARELSRYPDARVEVIGSPRLDDLALCGRRPADRIHLPGSRRPVVAFAWHWNCPLVPETRETFTYWRHAVRDLAASGEWEVLGHGHPRWFPELRILYEKMGVEPVADFADVVARVDVVAFDNSSVGYEACALGIPVLALNHPRYRRDVHHGLRFWDAVPGPQCDEPARLDFALHETRSAHVRSGLIDSIYPPETRGCAARLGADAIVGWVASRP